MGNSNVVQHSKWRIVSPDNSLLDLHEGHSSRSPDEVPNALVCWEGQMQRSTTGVWARHPAQPQDSHTRIKDDPWDKLKAVGFVGDPSDANYGKKLKNKTKKKSQENVDKERKYLFVSDEIISEPAVS